MTSAPVMTITEELLAELEEKAKAAVPGCCGEMIPTGVEYGGQREMMCCEAWQECDVSVGALDILALVEHIRSLTERLEKAEKDAGRYRWLRGQHDSNDSDYAVMKFSKRANEWLHLDWKLDAEIDSAIAQEGQNHE